MKPKKGKYVACIGYYSHEWCVLEKGEQYADVLLKGKLNNCETAEAIADFLNKREEGKNG